MPTPKKKKPYAVIREDGTYVVYDLNSDQFNAMIVAIMGEMKHVLVPDIGLIGLKDVRDVIEQREEMKTKPKEKEKEEPKQLQSGNPEMDAMSLAWLKQQQEELDEWKEKDELDGGRFS